MIAGGFDNRGRPVARATPYFPFRGSAAPVAFLIDTGSTQTIVMPIDARRLQIDCRRLGEPAQIGGIGGAIEAYTVKGVPVAFGEDGAKYTFETDIRIVDPSKYPELRFNSILGYDVWGKWNMTLHAQQRHISISPNKPPDGI